MRMRSKAVSILAFITLAAVSDMVAKEGDCMGQMWSDAIRGCGEMGQFIVFLVITVIPTVLLLLAARDYRF